jgi:hypothetical protein
MTVLNIFAVNLEKGGEKGISKAYGFDSYRPNFKK